MLGGALAAAAGSAVVGFALAALGLRRAAFSWRAFLVAGGWLWMPLWGAAAALALALPRVTEPRRRAWTIVLAAALAALPVFLRPVVPPERAGPPPVGQRAKIHAFRRWSYQSPAEVARILPYATDPDPIVREQAALALGLNTVVTDIEHATPGNPARFLASPVRDSLRVRLLALMSDSVETVRAEAARALWKAPVALGAPPAAAETLAAVLDRSGRPGEIERLTWLALDAAGAKPDSTLKAAAARFAASCPDTTLARVARLAAAWPARSR